MAWLHMTAKEYRETIRTRGKAQSARVTAKTQAKSVSWPATGIKSLNKYNAKKTTVNGVTFDSKKEAKTWERLCGMQRAGLITDLERQKRFELIPKQEDERAVYYVADYVYTIKDSGQHIVADCKSDMTKKLPAYIIKRKLMKWRYPEYKFIEL